MDREDYKNYIIRQRHQKEIWGRIKFMEEKFIDKRISTLVPSAYNYFNIFMPGRPTVSALAFDRFENFMLCGHTNGYVSVNDLTKHVKLDRNKTIDMSSIKNEEHSSRVTACKWYPNNELKFMTAEHNGVLKLWDTRTLLAMTTFPTEDPILDLDCISNGEQEAYVAMVSGVEHVNVRDTRDLNILGVRFPVNRNPMCVKWSHNGTLFVGGELGQILEYDMRSYRLSSGDPNPIKTLKIPNEENVTLIDIKLAMNHRKILALGSNQKVYVWAMEERAYEGYTRTSGMETHYPGPFWPRFDVFDGGKSIFIAVPVNDKISIRKIDYHEKSVTGQVQDAAYLENVILCGFRKSYHQLFVSSETRSFDMWLPKSDEWFPPSDGVFPHNMQVDIQHRIIQMDE